MKKFKLIILLFLFLCSCSNGQFPFEQKVLLEKPSRLIVFSDTKEPYSGLITTKSNSETQFYGEVLKGQRHGICYWIGSKSDTIQLQIFEYGDMVYSNQFKANGERSENYDWKKYKLEVTRNDSLLIDNVFFLFKTGEFNSIPNFIKGEENIIDYSKEIEEQCMNFQKIYGEIKEIKLIEIKKSSYNFRPEKYIEFWGDAQFERKTLKLGFRILQLESKIKSLEIWELQEVSTNSKPTYEELGLWAFLNI